MARTLTDYLSILLRRWPALALPLIIVAIITALTTRPTPITYQVTLSFAVGLPPEPLRAEAYNFDRHYNWLASEYVTQGFALIVGKGMFAEAVQRRLAARGIQLGAPLAGAIRSEYRSSVMVVYVTWPDAELAAHIAQAVVDELNENYEAYWPQLKGASESPFRLMDPIVPVSVPLPLRDRFDVPVRFAAAALLGVLLAFTWHALDPFVHDRRDLEQLGLNVIATVRK
ncbi:MAG: hypothetical protein RMJ86_01640 [Anaerolineae bacterium]|nr:hypothetical protein [Thermoflexales bacterium]MDW8053237.1 hypothetical protein [Anaerolineae bacterium]